jgi:hypothetical protein
MKKHIYTIFGVLTTLLGVFCTYQFFKTNVDWVSILYCMGAIFLLGPAIDGWTNFYKNFF